MKFQTKQKHLIDFIFPVSLFFIFALCALTVLLLSARIYRSITASSALNDTARTGLSYISEKIHQNDGNGSIQIGTLDETDSLIIQQSYEGSTYFTYIYAYDGALRELFIKEGSEADLSSGTKILAVDHFSMEEVSEHLFQFNCTAEDGKEDSILVCVRSVPNSL